MCYKSLREHSDLRVPKIDNKTSYCISSTKEVTVTFKKPVIVSGIALQGDSEQNGWITKFALSYQKNRHLEIVTEIGSVSNLYNSIFIQYGILMRYMFK